MNRRVAGITLTLAAVAAAPGCCSNDGQCQDGVACNGFERCVLGSCTAGEPVVCDDGVPCTIDACQEPTGACLYTPVDAACDDGATCNGAESCDPSAGCVPGTPWDCSDGIDCTSDLCVEPEPPGDTPSCNHPPRDERCDNGLFCDGPERCAVDVGCLPGTPPTCDDSIDCTHDSCDAGIDACTHAPDDALCDDGAWCDGPEVCLADAGCAPGTPPDCSDGITCTADDCDEELDRCAWTIDLDRCPLPPVCQVAVCDPTAAPAIDCGFTPAPDGSPCDVGPATPGVCRGGACVERTCGNGIPDPDEECDHAGQSLGCDTNCTTFDFVATDASPLDGDDGREELGPADHTVAVLDDGRVVLAWTQDQDLDPTYADVRARVLDPATGLLTTDLPITDLARPQEHPVVATLGADRFVVAWQGYGEAAGGEDVDIHFRLCSVTLETGVGDVGDRLVARCLSPVRANTTVGEAQLHPTLAVSPLRDRFVLAWEDWSAGAEGPTPWGLCGIRYRVFDAAGGVPAAGFASDRLANTTTAGAQTEPAVAAGATGEFLIAWTDDSGSEPGGSGTAIHAQRFDATGTTRLGAEFRVNARTAHDQYEPTVAAVEFPEPGYVVAWTDLEDDGRLTVRANFIFAAGGLDPAGELVLPHAMTPPPAPPARTPMQSAPSLAAGADSETLVAVWMEEPRGAFRLADDSFTAIGGVRLAVACPEAGSCGLAVLSPADALLNTTRLDVQERPSVAFGAPIWPDDPPGPLAVAFTDWSDADGSGGLDEVRIRYLPHGWVLEATP